MFAPKPVILVGLITAICLLGDSALYALLPSRFEVFAVTPTGVGIILGINRFIRILSNGWASRAYERYGFYRPFAFSIFLAVITTLGYGIGKGLWPLVIAHGTWGIAWSLIRMGGYLAVIDSSKGNTGQLMGYLQSFSRGGSLLAVIIGGILSDFNGASNVFLIFGVITISGFGLLPFVSLNGHLGSEKNTARKLEDRKLQSQNLKTGSVQTPYIWISTVTSYLVREVREIIGVGEVSERGLIRTLYFLAFVGWLIVAGLVVATTGWLVREIVGEEAIMFGFVLGVGTLTGLIIAIRWLGDLSLGPIIGYLSDRAGRPVVIITSLCIIGASLTAVAIIPTLWIVIPSFTLIFFSGTGLLVTLNASIAENAPPQTRLAILGRYATFSDIGSGTGPIIGLAMVEHLGVSWAYGLAAFIIFLTVGVFMKRIQENN